MWYYLTFWPTQFRGPSPTTPTFSPSRDPTEKSKEIILFYTVINKIICFLLQVCLAYTNTIDVFQKIANKCIYRQICILLLLLIAFSLIKNSNNIPKPFFINWNNNVIRKINSYTYLNIQKHLSIMLKKKKIHLPFGLVMLKYSLQHCL